MYFTRSRCFDFSMFKIHIRIVQYIFYRRGAEDLEHPSFPLDLAGLRAWSLVPDPAGGMQPFRFEGLLGFRFALFEHLVGSRWRGDIQIPFCWQHHQVVILQHLAEAANCETQNGDG